MHVAHSQIVSFVFLQLFVGIALMLDFSLYAVFRLSAIGCLTREHDMVGARPHGGLHVVDFFGCDFPVDREHALQKPGRADRFHMMFAAA